MERRLIVLGLVLLAGCTSGASSRPKTYKTTGKVTLNGAAVEGATVNFIPMEGKGSAIGVTDKDGVYEMTTFRSGDGCLPGSYKVSIVKTEGGASAPPPATPPPGTLASGELGAEYAPPGGAAAAPAPTGPKSLVPAQYSNPDTSGLRATVSENEADNVNDFQLK